MKQFNSNACGTIALMHLLANIHLNPEFPKDFPLFHEDSEILKFLSVSSQMNPDERGHYFEDSDEINRIHLNAVSMNQCKEFHEKVDYHFTAFANVGGLIVEFDGCKENPIIWTPVNTNFVSDTILLLKEIVELSKFEKFTVLVLSPQ